MLLKIIWPVVRLWRKYTLPYKIKAYQKKIYQKYNSITKSDFLDVRIVLMYDENFNNGGLVDRIKGLVSAYFLSEYYKVPIAVYFKNNDDSFKRIINEKNIEIFDSHSKIIFNRKESFPLVFYNYFPGSEKKISKSISLNKQCHLYCNVNLLPLFIENKIDIMQKWSQIFNKIFILPTLNQHQKNIFTDKKCIGIHLRFIGLLGDFRDLRTYSYSDSEISNMLDWCFYQIKKIVESNSECIFQIVSDSCIFLDKLSHFSKTCKLDSKINFDFRDIGHTALDKSDTIFFKAVNDFKILSECKKVFQLRYGKMHNSDFSRYAAMINLNDFEIVENDVSS